VLDVVNRRRSLFKKSGTQQPEFLRHAIECYAPGKGFIVESFIRQRCFHLFAPFGALVRRDIALQPMPLFNGFQRLIVFAPPARQVGKAFAQPG